MDNKKRAQKGIYTRRVEKGRDGEKIIRADDLTPDQMHELIKQSEERERSYEKKRLEANEKFISNLEKDLEEQNRLIWEECNIREEAIKIKNLILSRLEVLEEAKDFDNENNPTEIQRYERAINKAKNLLKIIEGKIDIFSKEVDDRETHFKIKNPKDVSGVFWKWDDIPKNPFKGISESDFFKMVELADFSKAQQRQNKRRIESTIWKIRKSMDDDEWIIKAALSINSTHDSCSRHTEYLYK